MRTLWIVVRKHPKLPKFVVLRAFYNKEEARDWLADHKDIVFSVEWNGNKWERSYVDNRYPNEIIELIATQINGE